MSKVLHLTFVVEGSQGRDLRTGIQETLQRVRMAMYEHLRTENNLHSFEIVVTSEKVHNIETK